MNAEFRFCHSQRISLSGYGVLCICKEAKKPLTIKDIQSVSGMGEKAVREWGDELARIGKLKKVYVPRGGNRRRGNPNVSTFEYINNETARN